MICRHCGTSNPEGATSCINCGAGLEDSSSQNSYGTSNYSQYDYNQSQYNQYTYNQPYQNTYTNNQPQPKPGTGLAIASMVCGIISFFCFAYIMGILGIVFGAVAKSKGCKSGMATAGIVCGILGIVLWLLIQFVFYL